MIPPLRTRGSRQWAQTRRVPTDALELEEEEESAELVVGGSESSKTTIGWEADDAGNVACLVLELVGEGGWKSKVNPGGGVWGCVRICV